MSRAHRSHLKPQGPMISQGHSHPRVICSPFSWAALALKVSEKLGVHVALSSDLIRGLDRTDF